MTRPLLWLARHGETEWSAAGKHTGRTDIPLTAAGETAARDVGQRLRRFDICPETVFTSPLSRAQDTARAAGYAADAVVDGDLAEWDYGDYEGLTTAEIREHRPGWTVWHDGCPNGESAADVGARADRVVEKVRAGNGDALAFAHGHLLRVLAARWVDLPATDGARLALDTAALCLLGWERETPVVRLWNLTR